MKANKLGKIAKLSFVLSLPALMANSPAPRMSDDSYEDIRYSFVRQESNENNNGGKWLYFNVENIGTGYITDVKLNKQGRMLNYGAIDSPAINFTNMLIPPGTSAIFSFYTFDSSSIESYSLSALGYSEFYSGTITPSTNQLVLSDHSSGNVNYFFYKFDTELSFDPANGYIYYYILDFNYEGNRYATSTQSTYQTFTFRQELDLSKLAINEIRVAQIKLKESMVPAIIESVLYALMLATIILLAGGIAFLIIFFSIRGKRRRNKAL